MKKIKIVVEDTEKGTFSISVTQKEARMLYDIYYMADETNFIKTLKLNCLDKTFFKFHKKICKLIDSIDDGKSFTFDKDERLVESKRKFWHSGRAPRWKKH